MRILDILKSRLALKSDYKITFGTPQGQRVLAHLAKVTFVTTPATHPDQAEMQRREGMRHVVLSIMAMLNKPDTALLEIIKKEQEQESYANSD